MRRAVLLSGLGLHAAGIGIIMTAALPCVLTLAAAAAWLMLGAREIVHLRRGFCRCRRLRLMADGRLLLLDERGHWRTAALLPGSVVLRRLAWIRFQTEQGSRGAELLRGHCRAVHDWRRLQVIWPHVGGAL